jgi:hypothetical protein
VYALDEKLSSRLVTERWLPLMLELTELAGRSVMDTGSLRQRPRGHHSRGFPRRPRDHCPRGERPQPGPQTDGEDVHYVLS